MALTQDLGAFVSRVAAEGVPDEARQDCLRYGRFEGDAAAFFERIEAMQSQPAGL